MALSLTPQQIVDKDEYDLLKIAGSWLRVPLQAVATVQNGFAFKSEFFDRTDGMPLIRIRDVTKEETEHRYRGEYLEEYVVRNGDILIGMDGDFKAAKWQGLDALLNQRVCRLVVTSDFYDRDFFFLCLQPYLNAINAETSSVTVKHLSSRSVQDIPLPLPPLNEQRRIVEKIEILFAELDKGEESLEAAKARAGLYRQSLLKHAFEGRLTADWRAANPDKLEDPETLLTRIQDERDARYKQALDDWQVELEKWRDEGEEGKKPTKPRRSKDPQPITDEETDQICSIPSEWCWARPDNLASPAPYSIGIGPFGSNLKVSDYREEGIPLVFVKNITRNDFSLSLKYVDQEKFEELQAHTALPNDILITKMGDPPGDCAIYPASSPVAVITADCLKFRIWDEFIDRKFVAYCLMSQHVRRQLGVITRGVAQKKISVERFKTIALPLPCQAEQEEIASRLEAKLSTLDAVEEQLETQIARSKALRQSILKRAFAGELVAQDPNDEPAAILLERITAEKAEAELAAKRDRKTKPARKPKNRRPTMTDLIEVLKKKGDWVSASKAAQGLGIADGTSSDDVEAFYRQLKERIEAKEIEVERRGDEDWLRLTKVEAT